jgi:magnesium transporter
MFSDADEAGVVDQSDRRAVDAPHSQTVAQFLVKAVPTARPDEYAGDVRTRLMGRRYHTASHIFLLTENDRLLGVAEMADLFAAAAHSPMRELLTNSSCPVVAPDTDREEAANIAIRSGVSSLAVCNADGSFVGAVPAVALISILRDEHLEDLHRMAGIFNQSEVARTAVTAPPFHRALSRLPWVLIGLAGSSVITAIMSWFEASLEKNIAVAFFIPALVYLADSVGTQSEVVAVRTLSLTNAPFGGLVAGEIGTGMIVGLVLSAIAYPLVWIVFGNSLLGLTVAIALFIATTVSTIVGFLLPWAFSRVGVDPALGSGPIATVFQDGLTLLVYFLVATVLIF